MEWRKLTYLPAIGNKSCDSQTHPLSNRMNTSTRTLNKHFTSLNLLHPNHNAITAVQPNNGPRRVDCFLRILYLEYAPVRGESSVGEVISRTRRCHGLLKKCGLERFVLVNIKDRQKMKDCGQILTKIFRGGGRDAIERSGAGEVCCVPLDCSPKIKI